MFQVKNKDTRTTPEQVNAGWDREAWNEAQKLGHTFVKELCKRTYKEHWQKIMNYGQI